jgi:hypothetical protein
LGQYGCFSVCLAGNILRFYVYLSQDDNGAVRDEKQTPNHQRRRGKKDDEIDNDETIILINITDSGKDLAMDRVLLENWYGLRHDSLKYGKGIDYIQQCCVSQHLPSKRSKFVSEPGCLMLTTYLSTDI